MTYQIIQPPFTLEFVKMKKGELKDYDKWFHSQVPVRVQELARTVRETPEFHSWQADCSPESLLSLAAWLQMEVETRPRTEEEIRDWAQDNPYPIEIPTRTLTNRSYSLAVDAGIYLSQVLVKSHPSLRWRQTLDDKRNADYGQPVLVGVFTSSDVVYEPG